MKTARSGSNGLSTIQMRILCQNESSTSASCVRVLVLIAHTFVIMNVVTFLGWWGVVERLPPFIFLR